MREINYRVWDQKEKLWVAGWSIGQSGVMSKIGDRIFSQYTGLKDKNGKEIYEGDIIGEESVYHFLEREGWKPSEGQWKIIGEKSKNFTGKGEEKYIAGYELTVVEWDDKSCGFEPFSDSRENCGHCGGGRKSPSFEVIGNIYENENLLNS